MSGEEVEDGMEDEVHLVIVCEAIESVRSSFVVRSSCVLSDDVVLTEWWQRDAIQAGEEEA